ncbi:MAG: GNAT family N-acetyltransferase [Maritimibacter sp.]|nr:GNAT family N-acetyltransferase [Maritimibacter sp.]
MKIEHIPELAIDKATAAEIGALLDLVFDGGFEGRGHYMHRHHLRIVARDAGRIVGHLALGLRTMRQGTRLIDTATVAEVAVTPERRGEGIASAMLAEAIAAAERTWADFLLLFGAAGLYRAAGFRPVANEMRRVEMAGRRTGAVIDEPAKGLMVRPLTDAAWDDTTPLDLLGAKF